MKYCNDNLWFCSQVERLHRFVLSLILCGKRCGLECHDVGVAGTSSYK